MRKLLIQNQNTITTQINMPRLSMLIFSVMNAVNPILEVEKVVPKLWTKQNKDSNSIQKSWFAHPVVQPSNSLTVKSMEKILFLSNAGTVVQ